MNEEKVPVDNAADEEQVKKGRKRRRREEIQEREDVRSLLATDFGRRFLWRYMKDCKVFSALRGPLPDLHFQEGFRQAGQNIMLDIIDADPGALINMMIEAGFGKENKKTP